MYNKKKNNKIMYIILIFLSTVGLIISINYNRKTSFLENKMKDLTILFNKIVMYPSTSLKKNLNIDQTESYIIQKNINSSLEKEIQELKQALELNRSLTEYTPINATILSRNKSYWFNTITIDKGKKSGIKENMAVITKNGLIGKITKVSDYSSEVKLITSDDINFKVSISIKTNDVDNYAIMNGYDAKTNLIKASGIDKTTEINIDDVVLTSGLGEKFPAGIYIGVVKKIESDKYDLSKTIYIETYQNFNEIHYVTVLGEKQWYH